MKVKFSVQASGNMSRIYPKSFTKVEWTNAHGNTDSFTFVHDEFGPRGEILSVAGQVQEQMARRGFVVAREDIVG